MKTIKFGFECQLLWFSMTTREVREETVEQGASLEVDLIQEIPYFPKNSHDFTREFRLERAGCYARLFESQGCEIDILDSDNTTRAVDSESSPVIVQDMNTMNNAVADLSVALPGEMMDVDFESLLAGDPEFATHMDARDEEALEFQMNQDSTELPY
jgi:hypothetical protein